MKILVPILSILVGGALGGFGGYVLKPTPPTPPQESSETADAALETEPDPLKDGTSDLLEMTNQFVVPVIDEGAVSSMVILSIALELRPGISERIYAREPKLRDLFLQALFEHARIGGFAGDFANSSSLNVLRRALLTVAVDEFGSDVLGILITDLTRRDT